MTPTELDPMPEDVRSLLESVRNRDGAPASAKAMVRSRLNQTLSLGWEQPAGPPGSNASPVARVPVARLSWSAGRVMLAAAGVAGVGGLLWAAGRTSPRYSQHSVPAVFAPVATPVAPERTAPHAAPGALPTQPEPWAPELGNPTGGPISGTSPSAVPATRTLDRSRGVRRAGPGSATNAPAPGIAEPPALSGERLLLEQAREALRDGDAPRALTAVGEHARRYPDGQLAEEREVLGIQAMVRSGSYAEARTRAQAFLTNYPDSPLHRVVQATVNSIP